LLALGHVPRPAPQQLQAAVQPVAQGFRREELDPRGGELERQRQPVQSQADLGDGRGIVVR
jgi:hypothetical protein